MSTKEKVVKKNDLKTIYGTGKSKYLPVGKKYTVHSVHAQTLIDKGFASLSPVEPGKGGKKGDSKS